MTTQKQPIRLTPEQSRLASDNYKLVMFVWGRIRRGIIRCNVRALRTDEELIHDVLVTAYLRAVRYYKPERAKFSTFATRLMIQELNRFCKEYAEKPRTVTVNLNGLLADKNREVEESSLVSDMMSDFGDLPEQEKNVLTQRFWNGKKMEDISLEMGCIKSAAHQVSKRAILILRKKLYKRIGKKLTDLYPETV